MKKRPPESALQPVAAGESIGAALAAACSVIDAIDARVLLCHVLQRDTAYLIAHGDDPLGADAVRRFELLVFRRAAGEPVAYITGHREFYGFDFKVAPVVLIPRPETELLVDLVLERIPQDTSRRVLDLGTGSACVAIAIAKHRPRTQVTAIDSSPGALALARKNARTLGVANLEFAQGEWFQAVPDRRFDLVVSNPPYVAAGDPHLGQGDLRFEPGPALISGEDGLEAIRLIVARAPEHLVPRGWLMFEHGYDQAAQSRSLLDAAGFQAVFSRRDLAGVERVSGGCRA